MYHRDAGKSVYPVGIISGSQREITRTITEQGRDGPAGKEFG